PPRIDQLLAADHRAAKIQSRIFLVLFWGGSAKKEPRREGRKKHGGAMSDGSSSDLLKGALAHIREEGHGMPLGLQAPNNASRAKGAHPK
ncbi:hypothetical protein, partial [Pseudodesulfovibrio sp. S3]|uniref:hypothetical protein n=1 Tax=Pseudodesulfovibrio sp. S3 TaxID=2283629 RepID=UPI0013E3FBE3